MAIVNADIALASATLSNGAVLQTAGGGMPARITPPNPVYYDWVAAGFSLIGSMIFGSDGASVIVIGNSVTKKVSFDEAGAPTIVWSVSTATAHGLFRKDADKIIVSRNTSSATFFEITESTGAVVTRTFTGTGATGTRRRILWDGSSYWSYEGITTMRQFNASFASTGTTIVFAAVPVQVDWSTEDGVGGFYTLGAISNVVQKYVAGVVDKTWTVTPLTGATAPGKLFYIELCIQPGGLPVLRSSGTGAIDLFPACSSGGSVVVDHTNTTRLVVGGTDIRGSAIASTGGGSQMCPGMDFSSTRFCFTTTNTTNTQQYGALRTKPIAPAKATFSKTFSATSTLKSIIVPGNLGSTYGPSSGWRSGDPIQDFRRTIPYYQRLTVDGARVPFTPGTPLSLTVGAGITLEVSADLYSGYATLNGPNPYVGGSDGSGVRLWYEDGLSVNVIPTVSAPSKHITLPTSSTTITATASDTDGTISSYLWTNISGPTTPTLTNETTATVTVSNCVAGTYVVRCAVTDNSGGTSFVDAYVFVDAAVINVIPICDAGVSVLLTQPNSSTSFSGTDSDLDGSIASRLWTQVSGPACTLSGTTTATLGVSSALTAGSYRFRYTVTDNAGATAFDDVWLFVTADHITYLRLTTPSPIVQPGNSTSIIALGVSGTPTDSDGSSTYLWTQVSGPSSTLSLATAFFINISNMNTVGTYVYRLTATDVLGNTTYQERSVFIVASLLPTVSSSGQSVQLPTSSTTLTAVGSDADGTIASYSWARVSGPNTPTLTNENTATVTIGVGATPLVFGTYVYRCTVTDNVGGTATVDSRVIVSKEPVVFSPGPSQFLVLPTNSTVITPTITSGAIATWFFRQLSAPVFPGPGSGRDPITQVVTLTELVPGSYFYQYEATDIYGTLWTYPIQVFIVAATPNVRPTVTVS